MPKTIYHALLVPFGWDQRFELLEKIGAGAMGQVWRAREIGSCGRKPVAENVGGGDGPPDHRLAAAATVAAGASPWGSDRIVALKFLDPTRAGDEQTLARLEIEGETLTKLRVAGSHEHVVPIIDFKVSDSHACLIMEFIPGLSLKKWCETYRLELRDRVRLIAQVARASGWFHGLGIVHRDLKPANILVHAVTHQPVIVDFSIAKQDEGVTLTLTNEALGTAPYMAPEQFDQRRGPICPATDVFALGATLYELLTQVHPHPGDFTQIMQRLVDEVRPAPPSALNPAVPKDLESIILKALSHRPADRYADGTELADDLDRFLAGEPVMARPISTVAYLARRARRKPALTAALAACLLLLSLMAWGYSAAVQERHIQELESGIRLLLEGSRWSILEFNAVDALLSELEKRNPARAQAMAAKVTSDVIHDVELALQKAFFSPDECKWINEDVRKWLHPEDPQSAASLTRRVADRLASWRLVTMIRPPFTNLAGFFPNADVRSDGQLLMPKIPAGQTATSHDVVISRNFQLPFELSLSLVQSHEQFEPITITFTEGERETGVRCLQAKDAPAEIINAFTSQTAPASDDYMLVAIVNGVLGKAQVIPKPPTLGQSMARQAFGLHLRWEEHQFEAHLGGQKGIILYDLEPATKKPGEKVCLMRWPIQIGLREMSMRTKTPGVSGPLSQADILYFQKRWFSAEGAYFKLTELPDVGDEACYKRMLCLWMLERKSEALRGWQSLAKKTGRWSQFSAFRLWFHTLEDHGMEAAAAYLQDLPADISEMPPEATTGISEMQRNEISHHYTRAAGSLDGLRFDPHLAVAALKVCRMMGMKPSDLASELTLPLHLHGLDDRALALLRVSFLNNSLPLPYTTANEALDHWCRIQQSERARDMGVLIKSLQDKPLPNQAMSRVIEQERCRSYARRQMWKEAQQSHQRLSDAKSEDTHDIITHALLGGALRYAMGDKTSAMTEWQRGITYGMSPEISDAGSLLDLLVLHSATRSWSRDACLKILPSLLGVSDFHRTSNRWQGELLRQFASSPSTLNFSAETSRGQLLIKQSAFRELSYRELAQHWRTLLLESYFLSTAFTQPTAEQETRAHQLTGQLTEALATLPEGEASLHAYFQTWALLPDEPDLAMFPIDPRFATLNTELQWLLAQRYRHLGKEAVAKRIQK